MTEKEMSEKMEKLLQKKAALEGQIARERRKEAKTKREADSHRKIVLGAVLLAAIRKGGISENSVRALIAHHAAEKDKPIFENWNFVTGEVVAPPEPEAVSAVPETPAPDSGNQVAGE